MPSELVSPNLHVTLIHYPLGIFIAGVLIELFSFLWRRSSFRAAGHWMILIGALSAIPATFSGIYALRDIARVDGDTHWAEVKSTSPVLSRPEIWEMMRNHMLYQSIATGVAALVVLIWLGASDAARKSLHLLLLAVLLADVGLMIVGSHLGGQAIYKKGVAIEAVFPFGPESRHLPTTTQKIAPVTWTDAPTRIEEMFPPLEMHVTMAGVAIAIAIASVGLSFRRINATHDLPDEPIVTGDPYDLARGTQSPRTPPTSVEMVRTFNPGLELESRPFAPAGRFWLLTFLIALCTLLGGLWVISRGADLLGQMKNQPKEIPRLIWMQIAPDVSNSQQKNFRSFTHAVTGSAIVALPIILAGLARFAPRQKLLLGFFTLLLAAAVTMQVWVGVLMLYDTDQGKLLYFNPPADVDPQP